ncbi:MAG: macrolide ABC transporter ATP-binding protein [Candidatus Kerfeldbacteria bacterium CG08_land_8_20_14_0_20_43_14]|uniref:Macrolide ABC transporter ATP-binding protein n=1 Tax=Candidatus Kerfeldbacteria bacterium CG08_land_8_20_14_0_20_43_14 TaxID=2014246 RepID=A0A2H0YR71_9BACT|nr:MAG: macrolide ABC transporter ATP-binding protein [Candidatus Kerfeldbacteria bacterium CG08_land_8_20_14_0_20_43_14]
MAIKPLITLKNVTKEFRFGKEPMRILRDVSLEIQPEQFAILLGPSGSGKSTLLHTLLGLEHPTSGQIIIANERLDLKKPDDLARFRLSRIGIIYQKSDWIRSLTVLDNVAFPLAILGIRRKEREARAMALLKQFGMDQRAKFIPSELSGGQQQKVQIARALVNNPTILVADEPTGNLDTESAEKVMQTFKKLNEEKKLTIIMVTHNMEYVHYASQTIYVRDGKVLSGTGTFLS